MREVQEKSKDRSRRHRTPGERKASDGRRVNKRGETLWYALTYREGGRYHEQALFERDGTTRPANEKRAVALAEKAEKAYRRKTPAQQKLTRYSKFTTVWPLFKAYHIDKLAKNTQSDYHWAYEGHFKTASFARKRVSNITHEDISAYVKQKLPNPRRSTLTRSTTTRGCWRSSSSSPSSRATGTAP